MHYVKTYLPGALAALVIVAVLSRYAPSVRDALIGGPPPVPATVPPPATFGPTLAAVAA